MRKIELPAKLTPDCAQALWYDLDASFDAGGEAPAAMLDAAEVRYLSAAALQVLLAAKARFLKDGGILKLTRPSEEFLNALQTMGASMLVEESML